MAALTLQNITRAGTTLTFGAAAGGGDTMPVGDRNFLYVKNGGGSPITVTVAAVTQCNQGSTHSISAVSVPNGSEKCWAPVNAIFADGTDGQAHITYSAVTSVTVAAVSLAAS